MKMTDEMRAAIASIWVGVDGARSMQTAAEQTILAGYRMGQQAMRERAAKVVADRIELSCGCDACCEDEDNVGRIRSLPVEE